MNAIATQTDVAVLSMLGERLAAHRLARNMTQAELAKEAGISKRTVVRIEAGESTQLANLIRVARVLGLLRNLDAFVPSPASSPIEQLRAQTQRRRRASRKRSARKNPVAWTWGESTANPGC